MQIVGPFIYDSTKPDFSGKITLSVEYTEDDAFLIARWEENAFTDHGDPNALSYEAALGQSTFILDILNLLLYVWNTLYWKQLMTYMIL